MLALVLYLVYSVQQFPTTNTWGVSLLNGHALAAGHHWSDKNNLAQS